MKRGPMVTRLARQVRLACQVITGRLRSAHQLGPGLAPKLKHVVERAFPGESAVLIFGDHPAEGPQHRKERPPGEPRFRLLADERELVFSPFARLDKSELPALSTGFVVQLPSLDRDRVVEDQNVLQDRPKLLVRGPLLAI